MLKIISLKHCQAKFDRVNILNQHPLNIYTGGTNTKQQTTSEYIKC